MKPQEAIHILMLCPSYWRIPLPARKKLVREYCQAVDPATAPNKVFRKKRGRVR